MNRPALRQRAFVSAVALVFAGYCIPARATNLLLNPGFEYPANMGSEDHENPTDWTFYEVAAADGLDIERENFYNNTPGGTYSVWLKTFESGNQGVYQRFNSGVQANTSYTFSGYYYFQTSFDAAPGSTTVAGGADAVVDLELTFLGASNNDLGADTATYIYASPQAQSDDSAWANANATTYASYVSPPTGAWTPYSVTATAPAGTASIVVSFDYYANSGSSGANISAFADDADLEGAGNPPTIPFWSSDSSGDWNSATNWSTFTIPNGIGTEADFLGAITQNRNVYTDIPVTVGTIKFDNANTYVIDGAGSLTLQVGTGNATVEVEAGTQEINLPLTLASNTVFNVAGGSTLVIADPMSVNSGVTLTQTGSGTVTYESTITVGSSSAIAFGNSTHAHSLTLLSSSNASIGGSGTVITLDSLALASGAKLDVAKDQVDVNYIGASPAASIGSEIATAYANGTWTGSGITSSAASYAAGTSVGYYDNGTQVIVRYTWIGDLNCDGVVNSSDLSALNYGAAHNLTGWQNGDLNYDGKINADDYSLFLYGVAKAGAENISMVPEPGALGMILAAGLFARRRKVS